MAGFAALHAAVFFLLTIIWLASDYFTGEGFTDAVSYHLRVGLGGAGVAEYLGILFLTLFLLAAAIFLSWKLSRFLSKDSSKQFSPGAVLCLLVLPVVCILHPTVNGILAGFNASIYGPGSMSERLFSAADSPFGDSEPFSDFYVQPEISPEAPPFPNLVMLYVESLERTYFDEERFPGLISELRELEREAISFTNIQQLHGTGFTMGGIVGSQCGLPLTTTGHPNSMRGMDQFMPGAVCLGDVLSDRDYGVHYMGGARLSFAGKGKFFDTHSFDSVSGLKALKPLLDDPSYVSSWGLYDDFLLEQFYRRFEDLSRSDSPFALVGLTMDTHHPNGHLSRRCLDREYAAGSVEILNAVKCADFLVTETIRKIRDSEWGKKTLLVVASDHLALKNGALDRLSSGPRRNLLWVFPPRSFQPAKVDKLGSTLDIAPTVLGYLGTGIDAFGLGTSLAGDAPGLQSRLQSADWQIREWHKELAGFWRLPGFIESIAVSAADLQVRVNGRTYQAPALFEIDRGRLESIRFEFDSHVTLDSYVGSADPSRVLVWIDECARVRAMSLQLPNRGNCMFIGKPGAVDALASTLDKDILLDEVSLHQFSKMPSEPPIVKARQASLAAYREHGSAGVRKFTFRLEGVSTAGQLSVQSSGGPATISQVDDGNLRWQLERGIHLLAIDRDMHAAPVATFDSCDENRPMQESISDVIEQASGEAQAFLLVSHDSATCGEPLDALFAGLGLQLWRQLEFRQPYVALLPRNGRPEKPLEAIGGPYTSLAVELVPGGQDSRPGSG